MKFAIGLGTTNACNFNCAHCYSRGTKLYYHSVGLIRDLTDNLDIDSINLGTGENGLNPHFNDILEFLHNKKIKISLTSNGYTIDFLSLKQLRYFNDIDISIDFADREKNDQFRGKGAYDLAIRGIEKSKDACVETSIACCLTNMNYKYMNEMLELSYKYKVNLRINIYKPVFTDKYKLTYKQFWDTIKLLFLNSKIVSCSEPIINTILGIKILDGGSPCGISSIRVRPDGIFIPCVYWPHGDVKMENIKKEGIIALVKSKELKKIQIVPEDCLDCEHIEICKGGCAARRYYTGLDKPDEYCYLKNDKTPPTLRYTFANCKDLVHSTYLCTIILSTL